MKTNIIVVFDEAEKNVLMCLRSKNPYKGLYNFVGGKVIGDETSLSAAYRELYEETGISSKDIDLNHFMDFCYHAIDLKLEVFVGKLKQSVSLIEEVNTLSWVSIDSDFFDVALFAGDGNIGHILLQIKKTWINK
ncbi:MULTISPECIES: NUDIX hydrolase [unclassified Breznakia]|uniref:NUDIX hydrolase n=1 Tax=unclassified Breznakia TaxID=2623764 RepID=UPI0024072522|nr:MULTISPECIES: NUDIX hydrolase [unclassified Breznakia]